MFKNTFQSGFLSILYSVGSKPLQIWDKKVICNLMPVVFCKQSAVIKIIAGKLKNKLFTLCCFYYFFDDYTLALI